MLQELVICEEQIAKQDMDERERATFSLWFLDEFVLAVWSHLLSVGVKQCAQLLADNAGLYNMKDSQLKLPDELSSACFSYWHYTSNKAGWPRNQYSNQKILL